MTLARQLWIAVPLLLSYVGLSICLALPYSTEAGRVPAGASAAGAIGFVLALAGAFFLPLVSGYRTSRALGFSQRVGVWLLVILFALVLATLLDGVLNVSTWPKYDWQRELIGGITTFYRPALAFIAIPLTYFGYAFAGRGSSKT